MAPIQVILRFPVGHAGSQHDNSPGPFHQLFVFGIQVHHQIPVYFPEPDHNGCGDHVQDHFLCRTGFEPGGAHQYLRTHHGVDGDIRCPIQGGMFIAGNGDGKGSAPSGFFQYSDDVGCLAAGGQTDDGVPAGDRLPLNLSDAFFLSVLNILLRDMKGILSSCHKTLNQLWIRSKGRRTFCSVQDCQPSAGSRAEVQKPAAFFHPGDDPVHRPGNVLQTSFHRIGHLFIFCIHHFQDIQSIDPVNIPAAAVLLFRCQGAQQIPGVLHFFIFRFAF